MNQTLGPAQQPASSELAAALGACRRAFVATAVFSGMSNILMLTGALFMLEVYDRILPSRSVPTLVALLILVAGLYAAQGIIDAIRSRILVRIGRSLDESMSGRDHPSAAQDRVQRRRCTAHSGSRYRAGLSFRKRAGCFFRFAMDAGLSGDLFFVSHFDRPYRAARRRHSCCSYADHRDQDPSPDPKRRAIRHGAQHVVGSKPSQCG